MNLPNVFDVPVVRSEGQYVTIVMDDGEVFASVSVSVTLINVVNPVDLIGVVFAQLETTMRAARERAARA